MQQQKLLTQKSKYNNYKVRYVIQRYRELYCKKEGGKTSEWGTKYVAGTFWDTIAC